MRHREVDLVVEDQAQMNNLLKFLIIKTQTLDGRYGSASKILHTMTEEAMKGQTDK